MCGIWCTIVRQQVDFENPNKKGLTHCQICACSSKRSKADRSQVASYAEDQDVQKMLNFHNRRGPDLSSESESENFSPTSCISISTPNSREENKTDPEFKTKEDPATTIVHLSGHVLWTQGPEPVPQPYFNEDKTKYLLFNGDIYTFSGSEGYDDTLFTPDKHNDGLIFFQMLQNHQNDDCDFSHNLINIISKVRGPFAFVYFDKLKNEIWFGRDFFGRQSLLFSFRNKDKGTDTDPYSSWNISSVSVFNRVFEIPTAGVYKLDLINERVTIIPFLCHDRQDVNQNVIKFGEFLGSIGLQLDLGQTRKIELSFSTKLHSGDDLIGNDIYKKLVHLSTMTSLPTSEVLVQTSKILDPYVTKFLYHLRRSIRLRLKAIAPYCKNCVKLAIEKSLPQPNCDHPLVGILFSGGLDSTVIAYLAIETLDKIDLLNVAFAKTESDNFDTVPDRQTALESYQMLQSIFQGKNKEINLLLINETKDKVKEMRKERIRELIYPLNSVLDDSLGCCLWFATACLQNGKNSTIRTVLMGSGADELLGGYGRHRSAYEKSGWTGLTSEMQLDIDRISIRNMGRDNRVVSDHGVCPRIPFLDEGVVDFLTECETWVKCCPLLGSRGLGEKLLLRAAAVKLFGEENAKVALFPKRAMQFGSRIAKLENSKEKGGDDCDRLMGSNK